MSLFRMHAEVFKTEMSVCLQLIFKRLMKNTHTHTHTYMDKANMVNINNFYSKCGVWVVIVVLFQILVCLQVSLIKN